MSYKKQNTFASFNSVMDFSLLCLVDKCRKMELIVIPSIWKILRCVDVGMSKTLFEELR